MMLEDTAKKYREV